MQELQDLHPDAVVSLREIGAETVATVCRLSDTLTEPKKNFVATNERSLEQAQANEKAWIAQYMPMTPRSGSSPCRSQLLVICGLHRRQSDMSHRCDASCSVALRCWFFTTRPALPTYFQVGDASQVNQSHRHYAARYPRRPDGPSIAPDR